MKLDVLVSTMNDDISLYDKMNIQGSAVIINQTSYTEEKTVKLNNEGRMKFISVEDRGLSKSRNLAIKNSDADICLFADNSQLFYDNYREIIKSAYTKYPDADIIAFSVKSNNPDRPRTRLKNGRVSRIMSLKLASEQISFKRHIIDENNLYINENFGTGSDKFNSGEENIFLYNAIKKGCKVYYVDELIAQKDLTISTWAGLDPEKDLLTKGAMFYQMSSVLYPIFNLQFAIRKHREYSMFTFVERIKKLFRGSKMGKNLI